MFDDVSFCIEWLLRRDGFVEGKANEIEWCLWDMPELEMITSSPHWPSLAEFQEMLTRRRVFP